MRFAVFLLISAIGVVGANSLLLAPIVIAVSETLGAAPSAIMRAASAFGLGTAVAALLLAPLSDRFGAARVLRLALLAMVAGLTVSASAPTLPALIAAQALCGLAAGAALPSIYALAAAISPPGREARTMGAVLTGWTVSLVLGVSVSAWATDLFGWRMVYLALAAVAALLWVLSRSLGPYGAPSGVVTSPLTALRVPGISRGLLAAALVMLAFYTTYFYTGAHVTLTLGGSTGEAGLVPLVYGIGFGLAVLADPLLDRIGPSRATPPLFALVALGYGAMAAMSGTYIGLLAMAFVWGLGQHLALNLVVARLSALDPAQRGAIMGLYSTVTYLCVFAAPFLGGGLFAAGGLAACLAMSAALCLAEAGESLSLRRRVRTGLTAP